jgi:hypothetical protein
MIIKSNKVDKLDKIYIWFYKENKI